MNSFHGISAAPGYALGPSYLYQPAEPIINKITILSCEDEISRLISAVDQAIGQLDEIIVEFTNNGDQLHAEVFNAQKIMLEDPELLKETCVIITTKYVNAEWAFFQIAEKFATQLDTLKDEYLRSRAADIRDICRRVEYILLEIDKTRAAELKQPSIIIAKDLTPSDTLHLDSSLVLGICIASGGVTSHAAIFARAMGVPTIVAAGEMILNISTGKHVIIDGFTGQLIADPDTKTLNKYSIKLKNYLKDQHVISTFANLPAMTLDGHQIEVVANIDGYESAKKAFESGAEGVGLLRTESLYIERNSLPNEENQYQEYMKIFNVFGTLPVVLRTLDIGGDKELTYMQQKKEENPFLGLRAIRLCLRNPDLLTVQIRAALRASYNHDLRLMFPMVSTISELRDTRKLVEECRLNLVAEGHLVADSIQQGIMIEIPAAALMADHFAEEVDFFSIGTNDLSQYTMAADRNNPDVAYLASGFQPAVLKLIDITIKSAHNKGKWVGICGELAGDSYAIPLLIGLGLDELSMAASFIPRAKQIIRSIRKNDMEELAHFALQQESSQAVIELVKKRLPNLAY